MTKETNPALSLGVDDPGHTVRSEPRMDHPRKQSPGLEHLRQPWRSKDSGKETTAVPHQRLEHAGHTDEVSPILNHLGKQGPRLEHAVQPRTSKGG